MNKSIQLYATRFLTRK